MRRAQDFATVAAGGATDATVPAASSLASAAVAVAPASARTTTKPSATVTAATVTATALASAALRAWGQHVDRDWNQSWDSL